MKIAAFLACRALGNKINAILHFDALNVFADEIE